MNTDQKFVFEINVPLNIMVEMDIWQEIENDEMFQVIETKGTEIVNKAIDKFKKELPEILKKELPQKVNQALEN